MSLVKIFFLQLLLYVPTIAQVTYDNGLISIRYDREPLYAVLEDIKNKTGANFVYNDNLIKSYTVSCKTDKTTIDRAIKKILNLPNLDYKKFAGNTYVLFRKFETHKKSRGTIITSQINITDIDSVSVLVHPEMISLNDPRYPLEAIKNNTEGKVMVKILINKEGKVIKTIIDKSSGYRVLDDAAIAYSRELQFKPALMNSKPIDIWLSMGFNYKLE
jgi:TonB family protein